MFCKNFLKKGKEIFKINAGENETNWLSILIASVLSFCCAVQVSVFFSSIWPFLTILDSTVTQTFYGFVIGGYSIGNVIFAPIFGYWSNKLGYIRYPLYASFISQLIGNIIYINLQYFEAQAKYWLLISRIFIGVGCSTISLFKSYAATASFNEDKTMAIVIVTGGFSLGMATGSFFNLLFTPIGYPGFQVFGIHINMYTLPGIIGLIANFISTLVLFFLFKEHYAGVVNKDGKKTKNYQKIPKFDKIPIIVLNLTRFCQLIIVSSLETINSPLTLMIFGMTKLESININSISHGFLGFVAFAVYFIYIFFKLEKYIKYRISIIIGTIGINLFFILTYSYSFLPQVPVYNSSIYKNETFINQTEVVGCDGDKFSWCNNMTSTISPIYYFILYSLLLSISYLLINIALNTLFSQVLGPRKQATQQGLLQMSGGIGQLIGPIIVTNLYSSYGPRIVWGSCISLISILLCFWIIFYKRMIPLKYQIDPIQVIHF